MDHEALASRTPAEASKEFAKTLGVLIEEWMGPEFKKHPKEHERAGKILKSLALEFNDIQNTPKEDVRARIIRGIKTQLGELEAIFAGQQMLFAKTVAARVLARFRGAKIDPKIKQVFDNLNELVDGIEKMIQTDDARSLGLIPRGPRTPTKRAPKTYAQAQAEVLDVLRKKGWAVVDGLKIPHATAPNKMFRLWFKPQAIYFSYGNNVKSLGEARSAWTPDYRHMSADEIVKHLEKQFAKELR